MPNKRPTAPAATEPSKSQLKREAKEMFDLGRQLAELPAPVLAQMPLEQDIMDAILFARSIKARVARKRQLGFVAKKLRNADVEPVLQALAQRQGAARESNARHHRSEAWRDALIEQGDEALSVLASARSDTNAQAVRQLVRNARREAGVNKPPASARKLFRLLREMDENETLPPNP